MGALPGQTLALQLAIGEAAVEDANKTISQSAEGLVVGLTASAMGIVIAASTWRPSQRGVRPALILRIAPPLVTDLRPWTTRRDGRPTAFQASPAPSVDRSRLLSRMPTSGLLVTGAIMGA